MGTDTYPLLQAQLGVFLDCQRVPDSTQYNIPLVMRLDERVDLNRLEKAIGLMIASRPVLRTRFSMEDGEVRQWSDAEMTIPVVRVSMPDDQVGTYVRETFVRPFDLLGGEPLARFAILETDVRPYLLIDIHHVLMDGSALGGQFLGCDLSAAYDGRELAEPGYGIFQAAVEETASFQTPRYAQDQEFQRALMSGRSFASFSDVPAGERLSPVFKAAERLSQASCDEWCERQHVRPSTLFEAAFALVLARFTRADSVAYTLEWHGRIDRRVRSAYGMFVRPLPIVSDVSGTTTVREFIDRCRSGFVDVRSHATYPFTHLCDEAGLVPSDSFNFIASAQLDFSTTLDGVRYRCERPVSQKSQEGLHCDIVLDGSDYEIQILSCTDRNSPESLRRIARAVRATVENMMAGPEARLSEISTVGADEAADLIALGTGAKIDYDTSETFVDLFLRYVKATPEAKAVVAANGMLTYGELDAQSSALAAALVEKGVKPGDFVAVKLGRVKEFPLAVIAIWKAGAAYVPVDPEYPADRIAYMLEDSGAKVVIDDRVIEEVRGQRSEVMTSRATPELLAYMIYTSGSTGKPKGVMVSHANLRAFLAWLPDELGLKPGEAVAEHASFSFDASICDLYTSLSRGVTLHILSSELRKDLNGLARYFIDNKIVGATLSTQLGMELLNACDLKLRYMVLGGEKLKHVKKTSVHLYNGYGPTEFTCWSSHHIVDQEKDGEDIPIGKAVPNTLSAIVDKSGNLVPRGIIGELVLAGAQLSRGYWHRPELTSERFAVLPFMKADGQAAYRTGDLARWDGNGELIYCGRIDTQVKLRGFRIEMGEIESAMAKFPGIASAVAEVKKVNGIDRLVGYYVEEEGQRSEVKGQRAEVGGQRSEVKGRRLEDDLKAFLAKSLTDYMVPDAFVRLDAFPLTPNGKVNRKALPVPEIKADEIVAPATELESALFEVVAAELQMREFGVTTNLISMGLTSLRAIRLSAAIKKATDLVVSTGDILAKPRIRDWASIGGAEVEVIAVLTPRETYPLTANQLGVYLDWARNRTGLQYNVPSSLRFVGVGAEKLRDAVAKAVAAHPYFKVRLEERDGTVVQVRRDEAALDISFEKLDSEPDAAFFQTRVRPFDLLKDGLARFEVYSAPEAAYLFIDVHHIIYDGGSAGVFIQAVVSALAGCEPAAEQASAYDYALHDAAWQESEAQAKAEAYFADLIAGMESFLYPPALSGANATGKAGVHSMRVPLAAIRAKCRELSVTENAFFATALCETFRRVSRTDDIQIATVSNGRSLAQLANTVGMFVETLPLVSRGMKGSAAEAIRAMQSEIAETLRYDRYPFTKLVERQGLKPNVLYVFQGGVVDSVGGPEMLNLSLDTAKVPLALSVFPKGDECEFVFEYDAGLYGADEIATLARALAALSANLAAQTCEDELSSVALVDDSEAADLLALGTGAKVDYDTGETFVDLFLRHVKATPEAKAVVAANGTLTYGELDAQSSALAAALVEKGVKPGDFVAVKLGRVKEFPLAVIAIWKAGAAYVPVDPEYPADRIAYMLEDSGAKVVIDDRVIEEVRGQRSEVMTSRATPELLAYMIYTSGSTGKPKGVMVSHANLRAFLAWLPDEFGLKPGEAVAEHASFSFDASICDLYTSLSRGVTLHILSSELRKDLNGLAKYLADNRIVGASFSTQFGMELVNTCELKLRYMVMGGEKLKHVKKTSVRLYNGYGPTEFTCWSSHHIVDQEKDGEDIPIGKAVPNTLSAVVDKSGNLVPRGIIGELVLAGAQLSRGYWHRPELTSERFAVLPFMKADGQAAYRTGDLARWDGNGELIYCGRIDTQVKLRGFRIEMGEIESAMAKFPGIASAVAEVKKVNGIDRLVGYYVEDEGQRSEVKGQRAEAGGQRSEVKGQRSEAGGQRSEVKGQRSEDDLKAFLAKSLTDYMVPDAFVRLDALPLTPNGKVNRRALPVPDAASFCGDYVEPTTDDERALCEAYGRILKMPRYGAETDFFQAGGSSLDAIGLVAELQRLGFKVVYGDLFKCKTPRALAAFLASESSTTQTSKTSETSQISQTSHTYSSFDYASIDALFAKTRTELFDGFGVQPLGGVLLTGATGYLGIHLLRYLLESTSSEVTVLLRPKGNAGPERRLDAQYVYYFGERLPDRFRDRISYVAGDITDKELKSKVEGLDISTVINCAALVKHYSADDALDRVNVRGVENLLAWCAEKGARFVQTSTYSVGGSVDASSLARLDERHLYVGQDSDNDYVRTKFLAERAVLSAVAAGMVRAKIMRLGNLMGREADGEFQMNVGANAFVNSLKSYSAIGAYPLDELVVPLEMSPIDRVAEAVCILATTPDDMVVFHPYNCYALDMGAVLGALNRRGHAVDYTSRADFAARVDALKSDPSHAKDLQGILHYAQRHLDGRKMTPVSNDWTTTVLYRLGFRWKPAEDRYLANFFDMLDGLAVFG